MAGLALAFGGVQGGRAVKHKGMTLVELMVVLVIVAVVAQLALPTFHRMVDKQRREVAANELVAALRAARVQAITRHVNVHVDAINGNWSEGWRVSAAGFEKSLHGYNDNVLQAYVLDGKLPILGNKWVSRGVRFDPLGGVLGSKEAFRTGTVFFCDKREPVARLGVVIALNGKVRITNKLDAKNPCSKRANRSP
jgi:type IV fimbrial biogenesis protein FimT